MSRRVASLLGLVGVLAVAAAAPPPRRSSGQSSTAVISGIVVSGDTPPQPIGRVVVTVTSPDLPNGRSAVTDDDGRFEIRELPATRASVTAVKRGFIPTAFGARRAGRAGTAVVLTAGERREVRLMMTRGSVITGAIRTAGGDPAANLIVVAERVPLVADDPPGIPTPWMGDNHLFRTDDRGTFRIFDLAPGSYVVAAFSEAEELQPVARGRDVDAALAALAAGRRDVPLRPGPGTTSPEYFTPAPVYYPGSVRRSDAQRVTLGAAEERGGIDFIWAPARVAALDGTLVVTAGAMPMGVRPALRSADQPLRSFRRGSRPTLTHPPDSDGRFRFENLLPGRYTMTASAARAATAAPAGRRGGGSPSEPTTETLYGMEDVDVHGADVGGFVLRLQPGVRIGGRVQFDLTGQVRIDPTTRLSLVRSPNRPGTMDFADASLTVATTPVAADGTFEFPSVGPGYYHLHWGKYVYNRPGTVWLRSAVIGGIDVLDTVLHVPPGGSDFRGAVLTVTDKPTELVGTLRSASGAAAPEYDVVVLPVERALWTPESRRLQLAAPDSDGTFRFRNLPGGIYLLAAASDLDPDDWQRDDVLGRLAAGAVRVTVRDGSVTQQDLRVR
jgi:hypothetical protein